MLTAILNFSFSSSAILMLRVGMKCCSVLLFSNETFNLIARLNHFLGESQQHHSQSYS